MLMVFRASKKQRAATLDEQCVALFGYLTIDSIALQVGDGEFRRRPEASRAFVDPLKTKVVLRSARGPCIVSNYTRKS